MFLSENTSASSSPTTPPPSHSEVGVRAAALVSVVDEIEGGGGPNAIPDESDSVLAVLAQPVGGERNPGSDSNLTQKQVEAFIVIYLDIVRLELARWFRMLTPSFQKKGYATAEALQKEWEMEIAKRAGRKAAGERLRSGITDLPNEYAIKPTDLVIRALLMRGKDAAKQVLNAWGNVQSAPVLKTSETRHTGVVAII
ncbi:TPA: hypothetical protein DCL30_04845 [Candidatus Peribacteria bacterium]|nr:hypothetical protein [Candidatus Peribacteria bacterium]